MSSLKRFRKTGRCVIIALSLALQNSVTSAQESTRVHYGPSAYHYNQSPQHIRDNHLIAVERLFSDPVLAGAQRGLLGLALFNNSFGQFSQYLYVGQEWDVARLAGGMLYANLTAGLLHGYKGEFENKIPFNDLGVAPVLIPNLGWRSGRFSLGASVLGFNGLLLTFGWQFKDSE